MPAAQSPSEPEAAATRSERAHALTEARAHAKSKMSDPAALKAWAWAAFHAGEMREARRAGQAWSLHDGTVEPKIFLANVLDASGHRTQAKLVMDEWLETHPEDDEARAELAKIAGGGGTKAEIARK
jgi:hypothetical protein